MNSILIIEDDPTIRETLEYNLQSEGYLTSTAGDGRSGLSKALSDHPDLILLDLLLPKMDGREVCRALREKKSDARVIMITALGTDADKVKGLEVGADDYVTKPFNLAELLARVRAQLRRHPDSQSEQEILHFGDVEIDLIKHELRVDGRAVKVTPKEWRLLVTLASNPGVLFSRQELISIVWDNEFLGSSRTIDVHVQQLRKKVENRSAYSFIHTIHSLGYRFDVVTQGDRSES